MIPSEWKTGTVVPLFKDGNAKLISNYRPIILLPQIVKVFEKLVHKRMLHHLTSSQFLVDEQGGFLPQCGIRDTIGKFLGSIYYNINSGNSTLEIFFDLKKAFDTTDQLLQNYLTDRSQSTRVNDVTSSKLSITQGQGQGQ